MITCTKKEKLKLYRVKTKIYVIKITNITLNLKLINYLNKLLATGLLFKNLMLRKMPNLKILSIRVFYLLNKSLSPLYLKITPKFNPFINTKELMCHILSKILQKHHQLIITYHQNVR